jgi:rod shape determining protein RodA
MGWGNIYSAAYNESASGLFDIGQRYGMQALWIGVSLFAAIAIVMIDPQYYHILAYPAYIIGILVLLVVLGFGDTVNGAKAWIKIGNFSLQPTELAKFTTALAVARYMSQYSFSIHRFRHILWTMLLIAAPALIIILQNDTGSAVVYGAFFIVFYREGLNGWFFAALVMAVALFVASFLLTPFAILAGLIVVCVVAEGVRNGHWRSKIIYLSAVALIMLAIYFGVSMLAGGHISLYSSLLISAGVSMILVVMYAFRNKLRNVYLYIAFFVASVAVQATVDYVFDNVLQEHQQQRILHLLGIEDDTVKWGYNVDQSKIAIGSGGFLGKGFLEGTQTRYNFVPEQETDFIFATVGEEWGFVGSAVVVALFFVMIMRLYRMGERQNETFGRIYCYSAASIFLVHVVINVGMAIGIMPVIGIPLPFFSYGGSSLLAFTILFFVAVRLDSARREGSMLTYQ